MGAVVTQFYNSLLSRRVPGCYVGYVRWTVNVELTRLNFSIAASSTVDAVLVTLGDRGTGTLSSDKAWNLHLELLMYIPMLVTNIYATGLISYRAW